MRSFLALCLSCMLILGLPASSASSHADGQERLDTLAASVVFLKLNKKSLLNSFTPNRYITTTQQVLGTGFLVVRNESEYFLVTAAHVARLMDADAIVTLRADLPEPVTISITLLTGQPDTPDWIMHPAADVACLRLALSRNMLSKLQKHFLPVSALESAESAPSRDDQLVIMGFPLGLGAKGNFSPISRKSYAASGLLEYQFPGEQAATYFLLQDPGVGGFSGGPVFDVGGVSSNGNAFRSKVKVVGLIKGTISDNTGGKFAAIVPAKFIVETLNLSK